MDDLIDRKDVQGVLPVRTKLLIFSIIAELFTAAALQPRLEQYAASDYKTLFQRAVNTAVYRCSLAVAFLRNAGKLTLNEALPFL